MPHQNRVTPFGTIIADAARGTLMGNRGCLHNHRQEIVRAYQEQRWIICLLAFKDRKQAIMYPNRYTQLFFLDEATALAAGHRPCAECQRDWFVLFRQHWAATHPGMTEGQQPGADSIDAALHAERVTRTSTPARMIRNTYEAPLGDLPFGTMVQLPHDATPYLVHHTALRPWSITGYGAARPRPADALVTVVTPRAIVATLAAGYCPTVHDSAD